MLNASPIAFKPISSHIGEGTLYGKNDKIWKQGHHTDILTEGKFITSDIYGLISPENQKDNFLQTGDFHLPRSGK